MFDQCLLTGATKSDTPTASKQRKWPRGALGRGEAARPPPAAGRDAARRAPPRTDGRRATRARCRRRPPPPLPPGATFGRAHALQQRWPRAGPRGDSAFGCRSGGAPGVGPSPRPVRPVGGAQRGAVRRPRLPTPLAAPAAAAQRAARREGAVGGCGPPPQTAGPGRRPDCGGAGFDRAPRRQPPPGVSLPARPPPMRPHLAGAARHAARQRGSSPASRAKRAWRYQAPRRRPMRPRRPGQGCAVRSKHPQAGRRVRAPLPPAPSRPDPRPCSSGPRLPPPRPAAANVPAPGATSRAGQNPPQSLKMGRRPPYAPVQPPQPLTLARVWRHRAPRNPFLRPRVSESTVVQHRSHRKRAGPARDPPARSDPRDTRGARAWRGGRRRAAGAHSDVGPDPGGGAAGGRACGCARPGAAGGGRGAGAAAPRRRRGVQRRRAPAARGPPRAARQSSSHPAPPAGALRPFSSSASIAGGEARDAAVRASARGAGAARAGLPPLPQAKAAFARAHPEYGYR
jgi:hypothetical protein